LHDDANDQCDDSQYDRDDQNFLHHFNRFILSTFLQAQRSARTQRF
jgi:hypothetical protein